MQINTSARAQQSRCFARGLYYALNGGRVMKYTTNLNGVDVGGVGQFLINDNGKFKVVNARLVSDTEIELIVSSGSKPIITEVYMLPTMTRANKLTLSVEQTASIIEGVRGQGCKRGARVAFKDYSSSGARYTLEEAKKLGEGVGYKLGKHQEIIPCVMPKEERIKRGLERVVEGFMVFEGNGEKDLYNPLCYRCEGVIDSLAK